MSGFGGMGDAQSNSDASWIVSFLVLEVPTRQPHGSLFLFFPLKKKNPH